MSPGGEPPQQQKESKSILRVHMQSRIYIDKSESLKMMEDQKSLMKDPPCQYVGLRFRKFSISARQELNGNIILAREREFFLAAISVCRSGICPQEKIH